MIDLHTHVLPGIDDGPALGRGLAQTSWTIAMTMPATTNATIAAWVQIQKGLTTRSSV